MFIFESNRERERERQSVSRGGAEREGNTQSEAAPGSELSAQEPNAGLELQTLRS